MTTSENAPDNELAHATTEELILELARRVRAVGGSALMAFDMPGKCLQLPGGSGFVCVGSLSSRLGMHEIMGLVLQCESESVVSHLVNRTKGTES